METSLPVLVARLKDRDAVAPFVRAALRHEIAEVRLETAPEAKGPHTLAFEVEGERVIALHAEVAGAPRRGFFFPVRLKPLHRAQAAELYALLEEADDLAPDEGADEEDDLLATGPRGTIRMDVPYTGEDPPLRSTAKSAELPADSGVDARDRSISVVFDDEPTDDVLPADEEMPSLSVSVVFEPDQDSPISQSVPVEIDAAPESHPTDLQELAPVEDDPFFDPVLANLPLPSLDDFPSPDDLPAPPAAAAAPVQDEDDEDDDADTIVRHQSAPQVPAATVAAVLGVSMDDVRAIEAPQIDQGTSPRRAKPTVTPTEEIPAPEARGPKDTVTLTGDIVTSDLPSTRARKKTTGRTRKKPTRSTRSGRGRTRHPVDPEGLYSGEGEDPLIGRTVAEGKYVIESLIGSGAAGAVYAAVHKELRRTVALKVLHPHYQQDPQFMKSFRGEALAASKLDHPNATRVLDFGQEPDGLVYIVMEHLSGRTLQTLLDEERRLSPERALEILIQVCAALSVAHDHGIIHRDIKPDNIMLVPSRDDEGTTFELVKVCDFGIAALQNPRPDDPDFDETEGVIAGTPEYMSPEQGRGEPIDLRSDVYSCGIMLYELVTGRPPFIADNPYEIISKHETEEPRPPSQILKGLDPLLEEVILRAISKEPAKRPASARELRLELKELLHASDDDSPDSREERSIVESVPMLDDPASGFAGFFITLASALLRTGPFERGNPEAGQASRILSRATSSALRGRRELTFARRDTQKAIGFCVMTGHAEITDLRRLLGSQVSGSYGEPFMDILVKKGIAALTLREGISENELSETLDLLLGRLAHDELREAFFKRGLLSVSALFVADILGRDRKLAWKVGLCASRVARDMRALSMVRGVSLKRMREVREDLFTDVGRVLSRAEEVRQLLFNADLIDEAVANLRGFSGFRAGPFLLDVIPQADCAPVVTLLLADLDAKEADPGLVRGYLHALASRLVRERSSESDRVLVELSRRGMLTVDDLPRDLADTVKVGSVATDLVTDPSVLLASIDAERDAEEYSQKVSLLEGAMNVLARKGEAKALLAAVTMLAQHAKGRGGRPGPREAAALRAMKSIIDKSRLAPVALALLTGPLAQREPARALIVLAGGAGAAALLATREQLRDPAVRPLFVRMMRETGAAGFTVVAQALGRVDASTEDGAALAEDLLRCLPDRQDATLGELAARFLPHPKLRPSALAALVGLWGERAKKPLQDALEFGDEPAQMVALHELRRLRWVEEAVVGFAERVLATRGSATDEVRAAAALTLADAHPSQRARAVAFLTKSVEAKRGVIAMLRGADGTDESAAVTEAMARALLALEPVEGAKIVKARIQRSEGSLRARLAALLTQSSPNVGG